MIGVKATVFKLAIYEKKDIHFNISAIFLLLIDKVLMMISRWIEFSQAP